MRVQGLTQAVIFFGPPSGKLGLETNFCDRLKSAETHKYIVLAYMMSNMSLLSTALKCTEVISDNTINFLTLHISVTNV